MDGHFRQGLPLHRLRERSLAVSRRFHLKDFSQTHLKIFSLTSPEMQMAFFHLVYMPGHKLPHSIGFLHAAVTWLRMGRIESSSGKSHDTVLGQFVLKELRGRPTINVVLQKLDPPDSDLPTCYKLPRQSRWRNRKRESRIPCQRGCGIHVTPNEQISPLLRPRSLYASARITSTPLYNLGLHFLGF